MSPTILNNLNNCFELLTPNGLTRLRIKTRGNVQTPRTSDRWFGCPLLGTALSRQLASGHGAPTATTAQLGSRYAWPNMQRRGEVIAWQVLRPREWGCRARMARFCFGQPPRSNGLWCGAGCRRSTSVASTEGERYASGTAGLGEPNALPQPKINAQ